MSKIEEALEKAKKLRESTGAKRTGSFGGTEISKEFEPIKFDNPYIISITQPDSPIAEEYRKLKSIIIRETKADFLNSIIITSAVDKEGKTLTATNLAISLAQAIDHSILLVDADLRKPLIHEYLGIKPKYGLSDYLTKDIDVSEIMVKTGIGKLVVIPAGNKSKNPVELLSSEKMKSLINELKHRYINRYVILDTPPLLSFAEAITLGSFVDGAIFVIREGYAQLKAVEEAINLLKDVNILGVVFNCVSKENLGEHYSRYYSYYYYGRKESVK
jgi:exopolysaccharide/PEP-CTERM locus tyrosine autokinase